MRTPSNDSSTMGRLRILVLAQRANPDYICGPLIAYSQAQALARLHDVSLVVDASNEEAVTRKQGALKTVEVVRMPWLDRIHAWSIDRVFKHNYNNQLLQAFMRPYSILFEWQAWRQMRTRIRNGEFDVVLRLLPVSMISLSPFGFFVRNGPVPFLVGPINGGLPWPPGFEQAKIQNKWVASGLRALYPFLPFGRSTYRRAAAIMAGSSHTYAELSAHREKLFFLPENGIEISMCSMGTRSRTPGSKLKLIFVGSLIPLKACDLALRGAASLLRSGLATFTLVGDGPERNRLEQLAKSLGVEEQVLFRGWLRHGEAMQELQSADILLFPSIRDFGGGVVFEALAQGVVPIVSDFGGPGDTVHPEVGCKVALTNEADVVSQIEQILLNLVHDEGRLDQLRNRGVSYAREYLSWDAKARTLTTIMRWVLRQGPKPNLPPPKVLSHERASLS
jgi:glycosyltransferase involved in cell wall biosynthesis